MDIYTGLVLWFSLFLFIIKYNNLLTPVGLLQAYLYFFIFVLELAVINRIEVNQKR